MINRRDFHKKLNFTYPLKGILSIHEFDGKILPQKTSLIQVNNLSINSIQFLSHLKFPIDSRITLYIRLQMFGQTHDLYGVIVWTKHIKVNQFQYDVTLHKTKLGYMKSIHNLTGDPNQNNVWSLIEVS